MLRKKRGFVVLGGNNDKIVDNITVRGEPEWVQKDKDGNIWVLTDGRLVNESSALYCLNPATHQIIKTYLFTDKTKVVSELKLDGKAETLYFIYGDIYKTSINDINPEMIVPANGKHFYAL